MIFRENPQLPYAIFFRVVLMNDYVKWNCKKYFILVTYVEIHEFMPVNTSYNENISRIVSKFNKNQLIKYA